jgi:hypothetical protein
MLFFFKWQLSRSANKGIDGGKITNKNGRLLRDEQFAGKCRTTHQRRK